MSRLCFVFDIDGTLADCSHRLHHIQKEPKDWDAFFDACGDDAPMPHVIAVAKALRTVGWPIIFVSGRSDRVRQQTATGWWPCGGRKAFPAPRSRRALSEAIALKSTPV